MTKPTAQAVSELLRAAVAKLDESVRVVQGAAPSEFEAYRRAVGRIMGAIYLDLLTPLYAQYPEIDPEKA
ncbi:MAG TPA: hypothetical protein VF994_00080 [Myxococcales bacterium]